MAKDKPKVAVVPILNKRLKSYPNHLGEETYPVYLRVFLGANNTQVSYSVVDPYGIVYTYVTEKEFTLIEEDYFSFKRLSKEKEFSAIAYEAKKLEQRIKELQDFHLDRRLPALKLSGLSKKIRYLYTPIKEVIAQDVSQKLYSWLKENAYLKNIMGSGKFSPKKPLEQTINHLIDLYCDSVIVFSEEILHDIEFAFLFKAYSSERKDSTDVYEALVLNAQIGFHDYLEDYKDTLFDKDV